METLNGDRLGVHDVTDSKVVRPILRLTLDATKERAHAGWLIAARTCSMAAGPRHGVLKGSANVRRSPGMRADKRMAR